MSVNRTVTVTDPAPTPVGGGNAYDLVTLDLVKSELTIGSDNPSDDIWFGRAITQASRAIANYCNRVFQIEGLLEQDYIDQDPFPYQTPGGLRILALARWPLVNLFSQPTAAATAAGNDVLVFATTARMTVGGSVAGMGIAAGTTILALPPDGISVQLSAPVTQSVLAGATILFGFTLTQTVDYAASQPLTYGRDYTIDPETGFLTRLNPFTGVTMTWEAMPVAVTYSAGYSDVPPDVEEACLRLITSRYRARGRDPALKAVEQPAIGIQTYWVGGPPKSGSMPLELAALLDTYRVPTVR